MCAIAPVDNRAGNIYLRIPVCFSYNVYLTQHRIIDVPKKILGFSFEEAGLA
jgi:hypothetical protein